MNRESQPPRRRFSQLDPLLLGLTCGVVSAVVYTCANICLRRVAHCDPYWVSCIKAVPTILLAGGMLLMELRRGERWTPRAKVIAGVVAAGLFAQLGGNVSFQWALGVVGLALTVPLTLGTILLAGAILGRVWLGEGITPRSALAMLLLIVSIAVLSLGSGDAYQSVASSTGHRQSPWLLTFGVLAALLSGVAYATLGAAIRRVARGVAPMSVTLLVVSLTGFLSLGPLSVGRLGIEGLLATSPADFSSMVWAGIFNAVAFFALSKSLQVLPVVHVNAITASQTAMAAIAGVLLYQEPTTWPLVAGVTLTVVGVLLVDRPPPAIAAADAEAEVAEGMGPGARG